MTIHPQRRVRFPPPAPYFTGVLLKYLIFGDKFKHEREAILTRQETPGSQTRQRHGQDLLDAQPRRWRRLRATDARLHPWATRIRRRFSDWDEAKREAELVATKLANGENEALRLTPTDRAIYVQAVDLLKSFNRPLNLALAEYVEALKLLPTGTSLKEAVTDFRHRHHSIRESRTVKELVAEFIATKEQAGRSERHLSDIRTRLTRFGEAFEMPVGQVTGPLIQSYLDALTVGEPEQTERFTPCGFPAAFRYPPQICASRFARRIGSRGETRVSAY